ncbi:MAG: hypothetical protein J6Y80_00595 [Victivallales bacterium]|nr:hypothetical protein [Victivallales bacterium]
MPPSVPAQKGYRRATSEELSEIRQLPGVREISRRFDADVFDARIKKE